MDDRFWHGPFFVMDRRNAPLEGGDRMPPIETTHPSTITITPAITVPEYHLPPVQAHGAYSVSGDGNPRLSHMFPGGSGDSAMSLEKPQDYGKYPVTTGNQDFGRFPVHGGNLGFGSSHGHSHFSSIDSGVMCGTGMAPEVQGMNLEKIYGSIETSRRNVLVEPGYPERLLNLSGGFKEFVEKSDVAAVINLNEGQTATLEVVGPQIGKQTLQNENTLEKHKLSKNSEQGQGLDLHRNDLQNEMKSKSLEDDSASKSVLKEETEKDNKEGETTVDKPVDSVVGNKHDGMEEDSGKESDRTADDGKAEEEEINNAEAENEAEDMEMIMLDIEQLCRKLTDGGQQYFLVSINDALQFRFLGSEKGKQFLDNNPDLAQRFFSYCYKKKKAKPLIEEESDNEFDSSPDMSFETDEPSDSETLDEVVRRVVSSIGKEENSENEDKPQEIEMMKTRLQIKTEAEAEKNDTETTVVQSKRKRKGIPRKLVRKIKKEKKEKPTKKELTCDFCQKEFPTLSKLSRHKSAHTGEKMYACTVCDKKYTRFYNLKDHMNNHKLKSKQEAGELKSDEDIEGADRLQCRVCNLILSSFRALSRHMMIHTGQVLKSCERCGKDFRRSDTYRIHLAKCGEIKDEADTEDDDEDTDDYVPDDEHAEQENSKRSNKKCILCNKKFRTVQLCRMHIRVVHESKDKFPCNLCSYKCSTKSHLNRHMKVHDNPKKFVCEKCNRRFRYEHSLTEHICKDQSKSVDGKHPCDVCGKIFNKRKNLLIHLRIHKDLPARHLCPICNKGFRDSSNLKKHIRFVHSAKRDFICDICGKGFKQNDTLKVHVQSHNPEKTNKYKCNTCGKLLSGSTALTVHERAHFNIKPFVCDVCGLRFSQSGNLQKHLLSHTDMVFYKCDQCDKGFKYIETWKAHQRAHALKEGRDDGAKYGKVYTCEYCGKKCATASQHKVHVRTHTNERPFPCQFCGKAFKESGKLQRHKKTHLSNNNHRVVVNDIKIETPITIKNYYSHHPETNQTFFNM